MDDSTIDVKQLMLSGRGISIQEMIQLKKDFEDEWDVLPQKEKIAKMKTHTLGLILKK